MGMVRRILGYATIGVAKESARRALESKSYIESGVFAAQTGVLAEAAKNLLGPEAEKLLPERPEKERSEK